MFAEDPANGLSLRLALSSERAEEPLPRSTREELGEEGGNELGPRGEADDRSLELRTTESVDKRSYEPRGDLRLGRRVGDLDPDRCVTHEQDLVTRPLRTRYVTRPVPQCRGHAVREITCAV